MEYLCIVPYQNFALQVLDKIYVIYYLRYSTHSVKKNSTCDLKSFLAPVKENVILLTGYPTFNYRSLSVYHNFFLYICTII